MDSTQTRMSRTHDTFSVHRKISAVNGRLDPDRCNGSSNKKLTARHTRLLEEWEADEDEGPVYKELKTAFKAYVTSGGVTLPKIWEEVRLFTGLW
jgi:hypothetical protein